MKHTSFATSSMSLPRIPTCQSIQAALELEAAVDALGESGPQARADHDPVTPIEPTR
jgi:hypothetical protein